MKGRASLRVLLCATCFAACGCGIERHAAESEFIGLTSTRDSLRNSFERVRPELIPLWERRLSQLERELEIAPPARTLAHIRALRDSLRALQPELEYEQVQLERDWESLRGSVPGTLARLAHDSDAEVRRAEKPLRAQWDRAIREYEAGRLASAVTAASSVRSKAIPLTAGLE